MSSDIPFHPERRSFLKSSSALALGGLAATSANAATSSLPNDEGIISPDATILFQGDSITDAGRDRKVPSQHDLGSLGNGYAFLAATELLIDRPDSGLKILNRGVGGNKVFQLADRWQADCLDLKPDVLSVLIGVNDVWQRIHGEYKGDLAVYSNDYHALIKRTRQSLPETKIVLCEPFVLKLGDENDAWFVEFDRFRAAAKKVADEFADVWVPFQSVLNAATKIAPAEHWLPDGVHPSPAGAAIMAHAWLTAVGA